MSVPGFPSQFVVIGRLRVALKFAEVCGFLWCPKMFVGARPIEVQLTAKDSRLLEAQN